MPSRTFTKKGKLNAAARQEINATASNRIIEKTASGENCGIAFARITKMLGMGRATCRITCGDATRELQVRIPPKFGRPGATPITANSVVGIFVGKDFDPTEKTFHTEHYDVSAIFTPRQIRELAQARTIPTWMLKSVDEIANGVTVATVDEEAGFEWAADSDSEDTLTETHALTRTQLRDAKKAADKPKTVRPSTVEEDEDDFVDSI